MRFELSNGTWSVGLVVCSLLCHPNVGYASNPSNTSDRCINVSKLAPVTSEAIQIVLGIVGEQYYEGNERHSIWTYSEILPLETLKCFDGNTSSSITVAHRGGLYPDGKVRSVWPMDAEFTAGDTVLVMLRHDWEDDRIKRTRVVGGRHGQFNVENGTFVDAELRGLKLTTALSCLRQIIDARNPSRLASLADVVCLGDISARTIAGDSTGEYSTITTVAVREFYVGQREDTYLSVVQSGDLSRRALWPYDQPILEENRRYVMFLVERDDGRYEMLGGFSGAYRVEGENVWRRNIRLQELVNAMNVVE